MQTSIPTDIRPNLAWLYFIFALEIGLLLFFAVLGIFTQLYDIEHVTHLLFYSAHAPLMIAIFELLRKYSEYREESSKPLTVERRFESIARIVGAFVILITDLFSLSTTAILRHEYHSYTIAVVTIVFWSLISFSTLAFLIAASVWDITLLRGLDYRKNR